MQLWIVHLSAVCKMRKRGEERRRRMGNKIIYSRRGNRDRCIQPGYIAFYLSFFIFIFNNSFSIIYRFIDR